MDAPETKSNDPLTVEILLAEYERAQEIAHHVDIIIHEVAAIVWGADTLLLGFILEVQCKPENEGLVIVAAILGIAISLYVPWVQWLTKKGQYVAFAICKEIETELPISHQIHNRIHKVYLKKGGHWAIWILTGVFVVGWFCVICHARTCVSQAGY